ncbi:OsmC family protein [Crocinitomix catalasitica]|nr:OsmC family protein [Crocinitomix catalasitica]
MGAKHRYKITNTWTGNPGEGTIDAAAYERSHRISIEGKADLICSSDTPFRGDGSKHNPEDMMVAALSACHMLWYLHLCADAGVVVTEYVDSATGVLEVRESDGGFTEVVLHPFVTVKEPSMKDKAKELHAMAHQKCFIAASVNFPVRHEAEIVVEN